jgi:hypothetical protein
VNYERVAFIVAFQDARAAVAAAAEAQLALASTHGRAAASSEFGWSFTHRRAESRSSQVRRRRRAPSGAHRSRGAWRPSAARRRPAILSRATIFAISGSIGSNISVRPKQLGNGDFPRMKTLYQSDLPVRPTPFVVASASWLRCPSFYSMGTARSSPAQEEAAKTSHFGWLAGMKRLASGSGRNENCRSPWPVILLRGLPATRGASRRFQVDSGAGSARDEEEAGVRYVKDIYYLQGFYGSDGTRTRDLRRDRPAF